MERAFILKNKIGIFVKIFIIVFLMELLFFNFSSIRTMFLTPIVLAENEKTDAYGCYEFHYENELGQEIENIEIDLDIQRYDRANVSLALTDEGNAALYELPEFEMIPNVKSSGYRNLYPYGKVTSLNLKVEVPEGTEAEIHSLTVNAHKKFEIKFARIIVLFFVSLLLYTVFGQRSFAVIPCERGNKKQQWITIMTVILLSVMALFMTMSNPACTRNLWPHHGQYQELAHALKEGTVILPHEVDERILSLKNPYDTSLLNEKQIPYMMDYAFYNGNYYAYFGIIPELLLYLPTLILTGKDLPNFLAVFVFYSGFIVGIFGLIFEVIHSLGKKIPYLSYLMLSTAFVLAAHYTVLVSRPDIYNVAVMSGNCFTALASFFLLKGINSKKKKSLWFLLGAFSFAFVAGCRPQMLLYTVVFLPWFISEIKKRELFSAKSWKESLALILPVCLVAMIVCWYNMARFGSPIDFGASYSLTTNDMNHRGFNISRTVRGLFSFYLQPPVFSTSFPFLQSVVLESQYMGKHIIEFFFGGILFTTPFTMILGYFLVGGKQIKKEKSLMMAVALMLISIVITIFDINAAGVIVRYMSDMSFGFMLAAVILWLYFLSGEKEERNMVNRLLCILFLLTVTISFFAVLSQEGSVHLNRYNPELYYKIASYFQF